MYHIAHLYQLIGDNTQVKKAENKLVCMQGERRVGCVNGWEDSKKEDDVKKESWKETMIHCCEGRREGGGGTSCLQQLFLLIPLFFLQNYSSFLPLLFAMPSLTSPLFPCISSPPPHLPSGCGLVWLVTVSGAQRSRSLCYCRRIVWARQWQVSCLPKLRRGKWRRGRKGRETVKETGMHKNAQ